MYGAVSAPLRSDSLSTNRRTIFPVIEAIERRAARKQGVLECRQGFSDHTDVNGCSCNAEDAREVIRVSCIVTNNPQEHIFIGERVFNGIREWSARLGREICAA